VRGIVLDSGGVLQLGRDGREPTVAFRPLSASFLDDVAAGVEGAREAGPHAVRYRDAAHTIAELEAWLDGPPRPRRGV